MSEMNDSFPAPCSVWPCPTCGAVNVNDAGNKCQADWVCSADDQRQIDNEREQSASNSPIRKSCQRDKSA